MHNAILLIISILSLIVSGCAQQKPAPIEFNYTEEPYKYNKTIPSSSYKIYSEEKISEHAINQKEAAQDRPTGFLKEKVKETNIKQGENDDHNIIDDKVKIIYHEVALGETIDKIAQDYHQSVTEIARANNLNPPYNLEEYQIIKIYTNAELLNLRNKKTHTETFANHNVTTHDITNTPDSTLNNQQQIQKQFIAPLNGVIITKFGEDISGVKSKGINISAPAGTEVRAIANGIVVYTAYDQKFGNLVIVKLEHELFAAYAHLQSLILEKGSIVKQNDLIGNVGDTGSVTQPQLYFAIKHKGIAMDPLKYISIP